MQEMECQAAREKTRDEIFACLPSFRFFFSRLRTAAFASVFCLRFLSFFFAFTLVSAGSVSNFAAVNYDRRAPGCCLSFNLWVGCHDAAPETSFYSCMLAMRATFVYFVLVSQYWYKVLRHTPSEFNFFYRS